MNLKALRHSSSVTLLCVALKTMILPALITWLAWLLGYRDLSLGVLFLLFMSPTATASFIMVKSMGGNDALAANLIMTTTFGVAADSESRSVFAASPGAGLIWRSALSSAVDLIPTNCMVELDWRSGETCSG